MARIEVTMKDGSKKEFKDSGRPGGSYYNKLEYVIGFVVVTDEWGQRTSIPSDQIAQIEETPDMRGRW